MKLNLIFLFYFIIITFISGKDVSPKRYSINLNLAPEIRWKKVINDYKKLIPLFIEAKKYDLFFCFYFK